MVELPRLRVRCLGPEEGLRGGERGSGIRVGDLVISSYWGRIDSVLIGEVWKVVVVEGGGIEIEREEEGGCSEVGVEKVDSTADIGPGVGVASFISVSGFQPSLSAFMISSSGNSNAGRRTPQESVCACVSSP